MNEIACTSSPVALPEARRPIAIRTATMADLPFLDGLQKKHNRALGYFPTKQFEGYIVAGAVLIAEERHEGTEARRHEGRDEELREQVNSLSASLPSPPLRASVPSCLRALPLGYIIARDRYLKRDELGVIYQLCVAPGDQRKLIGASLVKAVFERSAYGCRLFCCWCAQDLAANYFWESLGFVPIAFRAGSTGKRRVHIFWQKRIVENDATAWWYPFKTDQGAMREDRIVFPIPPGVRWSEVRAVALPACSTGLQPVLPEGGHGLKTRATKTPAKAGGPAGLRTMGGLYMAAPTPTVEKKQRPAKAKAPPVKYDGKHFAAARELRDRYLERVNAEPNALPAPAARYDVTRALPALSAVEGPAGATAPAMQIEANPLRQFPAAA